jgi:5-methylcytosine-specific restriction endonuclease McrA
MRVAESVMEPCKKTVKPATPQVPAPEVNVKKKPSWYIPATVKHHVWMRDKGRCTHEGCTSRHKLQYDHIKPLAKGGEASAMNLRLLCQTHNLLAARAEFGEEKISAYSRKL